MHMLSLLKSNEFALVVLNGVTVYAEENHDDDLRNEGFSAKSVVKEMGVALGVEPQVVTVPPEVYEDIDWGFDDILAWYKQQADPLTDRRNALLASLADHDEEVLDDLVHDLYSQEAADINNEGFEAQVKTIFRHLGADEAERQLNELL